MAPPTVTDDYYKVLEVSQSASTEEIKQSYRRLALKIHPDRNKGKDTKAAFQVLANAYETLSDENKRRLYDVTYHHSRKPQPEPQAPENHNETAQIFQLRKSVQELQNAKGERIATWTMHKGVIDTQILEIKRELRQIEQHIKILDSIAAAEKAEDARKHSWGAWLLSAFVQKREETDEQKEAKDRARKERRIERDIKERKLEAVKTKLKSSEDRLQTSQEQLDTANFKDDEKIRSMQARIRELEIIREKRIRQQQRAEQEKREQEDRARYRKEQERQQEEERARQRKAQEERERFQKEYERQQREEHERQQKAHEEWWARYEQEQAERKRQQQTQFQDETQETCLHGGWWSKIQGRASCPSCGDTWTYLLQCPGCTVKACPKCQAAFRPRGKQRRRKKTSKTFDY